LGKGDIRHECVLSANLPIANDLIWEVVPASGGEKRMFNLYRKPVLNVKQKNFHRSMLSLIPVRYFFADQTGKIAAGAAWCKMTE